ncbi:ComEC/Rec2 family competence protein [Rugamonas sp.]|uniref:ComEC/Rec2 family competence protein n=1 Tax=Rugamonas sp. TaxID=1926287 RepID=UPI0025F227C3|nr:ComEC/Rec2 family competence protein [Rugamonas sp.]
MRIGILGLVAGVSWLQMQGALPDFPALPAGVLLLLLLLLARRTARPRCLRGALACMAGFALGVGWAAYLAHLALAPELARADEGRDITLIGVADNLPYNFKDGVRFNFAVERVLADAGGAAPQIPPHVSLSWYANQRGPASAVGDVQPGERWQLTVRLQRPHGNANEYGFDYEVWLLEQGLRATGYVRPAAGNRRLDNFVFGFDNVVEHCRAVLRARILRALPGRPYAGVIVALVVGDQRTIDLVAYK